MENNSFLIYSGAKTLNKDYLDLIRLLNVTKKLPGILINFKYPSKNEKDHLGKEGIDTNKIKFIDGITLSADVLPDDQDIYTLLNLEDLEGIVAGINQYIQTQKDSKYIVIDIIDALLFNNTVEHVVEILLKIKEIAKSKNLMFYTFVDRTNLELIGKIINLYEVRLSCPIQDLEVSQEENISEEDIDKEEDDAKISDMERDALKEIGNIGSGNATTRLGNLIDSKIKLNLTEVKIIPVQELIESYQTKESKYVVAVFSRVSGVLPGSIITMFDKEYAIKIIDTIDKKEIGTTKEIDQYCEEILMQLGTIVSDSYLSALSDFLGIDQKTTKPIFSVNKKETVVSFMLRLMVSALNKQVMVINTNFNIDNDRMSGQFLLLFGISSLTKFKELISKKLGL